MPTKKPKPSDPGTPAKAKKPARKTPAKAGEAGVSASKKPRKAKAPEAASPPQDKARDFALEAARMLSDYQCSEVVVLDVRKLNPVTDYIVIGSGTSATQMRSILEHVEKLGAGQGFPAYRTNRDDRSLWLLLDTVDVVVHLFEPNTRAHYDLETMWGDAPRPEWQRPDQKTRDRAGLHA